MKEWKQVFGGLVLIISIASAFIYWYQQKCCSTFPYVDFDESMQLINYPQRFNNSHERCTYRIFKDLYKKNVSSREKSTSKTGIPRIIHQIWLGSSFPKKYEHFQQSWKKYHPTWQYRLWTERELANFPMQNRELYDRATNYGQKSDIARYEILYQIGGLYVDTDFECLTTLESLHQQYDFYIGIQPLDTNIVQLGIGLIGSCPGHPILKACIEHLPNNERQWQQIIYKTGPLYFTKIFQQYAPQGTSRAIALPATYFYPKGYTQRTSDQHLWRKKESLAVHHWEGSWLKQK